MLYMLAFLDYIWTSPEGWLGSPSPMNILPYFFNQANRWEVVGTMFRTHLGPVAWQMPGP
jgi:hypothetical protein